MVETGLLRHPKQRFAVGGLPETSFNATKDAARPADVTRNWRRLRLSRFGTESRASSTRASTCFCWGVCRNGGKYSSFDTRCVGIGKPNGSISVAGLHLANSCGVISGWP
jgi:hypothetical protein